MNDLLAEADDLVDSMTEKNEITHKQEELLYKILKATSENGKTIQSVEANLSALTTRYVAESEYRDQRINKLESRVDRLAIIISGALFVISAMLVAFMGYLVNLL